MSTERAGEDGGGVAWGTVRARWVLLATVMGSGLAFLDASTVNVALPKIERDLDTGVTGLQWVLNAYTLALAALIPMGGSLADRFGRRRLFQIGVTWFGLASLVCGLAPTGGTLALARGLQGVGGALLTPGSLAILQATFVREDRARAIGAWSGLSGIATALGPVVGGWLIDAWSWRWIFLANLPLVAVVLLVTAWYVPESRGIDAPGRFDVPGAVLVAAGLGSLSWSLISAGDKGIGPSQLVLAGAGLLALLAFVAVQARTRYPMMPLSLFRNRQFTAANVVTLAVYAALSGVMFLLVLYLQRVGDYSALQAGAALLPVTVFMLLFSARAGQLAERVGPRWPMTVGPLVMAGGMLMLLRGGIAAGYVTTVLPAVVVFGAGLALTVAPLTATALAGVPQRHSGLASAINNALSRGAGLLAVAVLPVAAGLSGVSYRDPELFVDGFRTAMLICAGFTAAGGLLAAVLVSDRIGEETPACPASTMPRARHCALDGPPIQEPTPTRQT